MLVAHQYFVIYGLHFFLPKNTILHLRLRKNSRLLALRCHEGSLADARFFASVALKPFPI